MPNPTPYQMEAIQRIRAVNKKRRKQKSASTNAYENTPSISPDTKSRSISPRSNISSSSSPHYSSLTPRLSSMKMKSFSNKKEKTKIASNNSLFPAKYVKYSRRKTQKIVQKNMEKHLK